MTVAAAVHRRDAVPPGCPLTPAEFECLRLLADGLTGKQIARVRGCGWPGVRTLLHTAYGRLDAANGAQAVAIMFAAGWLDPVEENPDTLRFTDRRVTAAQRLYLAAFDRFLKSGSAKDRADMTHLLRTMYFERGVPPVDVPPDRDQDSGRRGRRGTDPMCRLLAAIGVRMIQEAA